MRREAPRIPNPQRDYPAPGSPQEAQAFEETSRALMFFAMESFGPHSVGGGIGALCEALGLTYQMLDNVKEFYRSPGAFADACRTMVCESASELDDDELRGSD